jgi:hypothetical protein
VGAFLETKYLFIIQYGKTEARGVGIMGLQIELTDDEVTTLTANRDNPFDFSSYKPLLLKHIDDAQQANNNAIRINDLLENKERELESITNLLPLLFDKFFNTGENIILASRAGVGKSWLSIELAKNEKIKKALFLTIEDYNRRQLPRYFKSLSLEKVDVISHETWSNYVRTIKYAMIEKINLRSLFESQNIPYLRFVNRREQLLRQYGIKEENGLDGVLVFEHLMEELKETDYDFICIDSLNALLGSPNKITRQVIERIIAEPSKRHITLLIIHHINKKGEITGNSELVNVVDSAYILSKNKDKDKELILEEVKARFKEKEEVATMEMKKIDNYTVEFTELNITEYKKKTEDWYEDLSDLKKAVIDTFVQEGTDIITRETLDSAMADRGYENKTSISNGLKDLESKEKIVGIGSTKTTKWERIKLLITSILEGLDL